MAHAAMPVTRGSSGRVKQSATAISWAAIVALAVGFVIKYVVFYYRHYDAASFDPYWSRRGWLFLHINWRNYRSSHWSVAVLDGSSAEELAVHRWTGRLFLLGVGMGIIGAVGLSATTTYGWGFAVGIMGLASAWLVTTSMAYFTIRKGLVALHKEWMIRAYVVTFAFVTFRILSDYGPTSRLQPENERSVMIAWVCWVVPLAITEMVFPGTARCGPRLSQGAQPFDIN